MWISSRATSQRTTRWKAHPLLPGRRQQRRRTCYMQESMTKPQWVKVMNLLLEEQTGKIGKGLALRLKALEAGLKTKTQVDRVPQEGHRDVKGRGDTLAARMAALETREVAGSASTATTSTPTARTDGWSPTCIVFGGMPKECSETMAIDLVTRILKTSTRERQRRRRPR